MRYRGIRGPQIDKNQGLPEISRSPRIVVLPGVLFVAFKSYSSNRTAWVKELVGQHYHGAGEGLVRWTRGGGRGGGRRRSYRCFGAGGRGRSSPAGRGLTAGHKGRRCHGRARERLKSPLEPGARCDDKEFEAAPPCWSPVVGPSAPSPKLNQQGPPSRNTKELPGFRGTERSGF